MTQRELTQNFTFGALTFAVRNPKGVFIMSDALKQRISELPIAEAKAANSAAWKLRRQCARAMDRYNNATKYPGLYDDFAGPYGIAEAVCKETWKRIAS